MLFNCASCAFLQLLQGGKKVFAVGAWGCVELLFEPSQKTDVIAKTTHHPNTRKTFPLVDKLLGVVKSALHYVLHYCKVSFLLENVGNSAWG